MTQQVAAIPFSLFLAQRAPILLSLIVEESGFLSISSVRLNMLSIFFHPDSDDALLSRACHAYETLWKTEGEAMCQALEEVTGWSFGERMINAIVYEGRSLSRPMALRGSYVSWRKKAMLMHELGHRLQSRMLPPPTATGRERSRQLHQQLNLFLFPAWVQCLGTEQAMQAVAEESSLSDSVYRECWGQYIALTPQQRDDALQQLKQRAVNPSSH